MADRRHDRLIPELLDDSNVCDDGFKVILNLTGGGNRGGVKKVKILLRDCCCPPGPPPGDAARRGRRGS